MSTIREMIVRIKANFDNSEFGRAMNNIKQAVNSLPNPNLKAKVDNAEALKGLKKIEDEGKKLEKNPPHIKPKIDNYQAMRSLAEMKKAYNDTIKEMRYKFSKEIGVKFATGTSGAEAAVMGAGVAYAVKSAVDLDTAMLGVKKQVSDVTDAMGNYTERGERIKDMIRDISRESGASQGAVAGLFEEAGKSGIQSEEEIKSYTMQVLYSKAAFDLTDDSIGEFARGISEYQAAMKLSTKETGVFTDKLNYLDDQVANVTGPGLLDFAKRTSSTFKNAGLSIDLQLSIGATAQNTGLQPEVIGTAMNAIVPKLQTAKETFKKHDPFKAIGMTAAQVQEGMAKDADKTMLMLFQKAKLLDKVARANFLNDIAGTEHQSKLGALINNYDVLLDSMAKVESEQAKNSAQKEYEKKLGSISGQLETFKTNLADVAITSGETLLPALNSFLKAIVPIIRGVGDWIKQHKELVKNILGGIGVFVGLKAASMGLMTGVGVLGSFHKVVMMLAAPIATLKNVIMGVRAAMMLLAANPIVLAIYAIIIAVGLLIYNWDTVKSVTISVWNSITSTVSAAIENIKAMFMGLFESASKIWAGIKSFFGMGDTKLDINANKNIQMLMANPLGNQSQMLPQAVTNSYYQQQMSQAQSVDNRVTDNRTMNFTIAPNSSENQGKEISRIINEQTRQQNQRSLALAGSGFK